MPEHACIEQGGDLVMTTETEIAELHSADVSAAMDFHTQLSAAETAPQSLSQVAAPVVR
jgi:hypothetical protein